MYHFVSHVTIKKNFFEILNLDPVRTKLKAATWKIFIKSKISKEFQGPMQVAPTEFSFESFGADPF